MEAVPRMPMIWLELKEAGEFRFSSVVRQYIQQNYGEKPENYNEALRKLEQLRQSTINVPRDFEGCNTLKKYFGQLHYLQSRVPMAKGQEAAVSATWIDIFTGKQVTHDDISYEQACVLYNLGALHSFLGAMDNRVSEEGMKTSCTHFQCSAGAFAYIRDNYNSSFSSDISHQALCINISLMMGQAQECLLEKTLLDNRKSFLIARICAQVCDYYKECLRMLGSSDCGSGKRDWKKLLCMKISYFGAITDLHMGKQSEEQQKCGEAVAYFQISLNKLNEAIKLSKGQPDSIQQALRFSMDVIGGKFNSAKKDNDFIYHESVPSLDTLTAVKGASLVKPLPVTPADPNVTGPDLFSKLIPMATHEASSLYSEEKAKLLREVMAQIDDKNQILERFMDSLSFDSVDNLDTFNSVPPVLLEKCAGLSVRPDTVKSLVQAMQALSGVYTDVGSSLEEACHALEEDEAGEKTLVWVDGQNEHPGRPAALQELQRELQKYKEAHQTASHTNMELHHAMNQHVPNLRLLQGPLEQLKSSLPQPQLSQEDMSTLEAMKRILGKVNDMRKQRLSLEKQLRDLIQKDDITSVLVTTERYQMKALFEEQLQKYEQLKGFIIQNLAAQDNILKALTEANVQYAPVRRTITNTEQQRKSSVQALVASYDAYEDLVKKAEEGHKFYQDLEKKISNLLDRVKAFCQKRKEERIAFLEREVGKGPPPRPAPRKPMLGNNAPPSCPPGGAPFPNQRMPQFAQPPYGHTSGATPPTAPPQAPGPGYVLPQQFQPGPSRGITPVPSHMPPPAYVPDSWSHAPAAPFPGCCSMSGPQSASRPTGQQVPMPSGQLTGPVGHQIQTGNQYPSFPPQLTPGLLSQTSTSAFSGQSQPLFQPARLHFGPSNQFHQGQPPLNQPQAQMGHVFPSFPSYPQQMSGSFHNPNKKPPVSQTMSQIPFNQNPMMPFAVQPQMPPGAAPPPANMFFQAGLSHIQQQLPPSQPGTQQFMNTLLNPMFQPEKPAQNQNLPPQNIPSSSSGPAVAQVLDHPNPPPLADILTPSPANIPKIQGNQTASGSILTPSTMESSVVPSEGFQIRPSSLDPMTPASHVSPNHDHFHNTLEKLSITNEGDGPQLK
ncbi:tyrosine-protein phosphatase non-receptor type 23b [Electrophorus electricus]|uniref:tyrosine-protein phosphatase non-receptor type 23b n=1 Tax=Electrophorus electricus TaxID=8005 RepID=UPI0015D039A2|nr:tyrosine-protein phosphatase non-receptor type 23b [Electrophorus electricus]